MKVVFFIHSLAAGGAERFTVTLANAFSRRGWKVAVLTMADCEKDFYPLDGGVERYCLNLQLTSSGSGRAVLNNMRRIFALRRFLSSYRPEAAIGVMSTASCLLALAGWRLPVMMVGTERTYPPALPLGRAWEKIRRWAYGGLQAVVTQTDAGAAWVMENTRAKLVQVIANPISLPLPSSGRRVEPAEVLNSLGKTRLLLAVGRFTEEKGFVRLLHIFSLLRKRNSEWAMVIVGDGPLRPMLEALCSSEGLESSVCLPGVVGNMSDWYGAADLYVLSSSFEGFPNALLEAVAHGCRVVATDCKTGPREILDGGRHGRLVPPDDNEALYQALNEEMASRFSGCHSLDVAREVRSRYSTENVVDQWERLLESHSTFRGAR